MREKPATIACRIGIRKTATTEELTALSKRLEHAQDEEMMNSGVLWRFFGGLDDLREGELPLPEGVELARDVQLMREAWPRHFGQALEIPAEIEEQMKSFGDLGSERRLMVILRVDADVDVEEATQALKEAVGLDLLDHFEYEEVPEEPGEEEEEDR